MSKFHAASWAFAIALFLALPLSPAFSAEEKAGDSSAETVAGDDKEVDHDHPEGDHAEDNLPPILSFDPGAAVANVLIFLGVLAILSFFVWPVILNGLIAREEKIANDLQQAKDANAKAAGLLAQYETQLADANVKAQAILAEARQAAEGNASKIMEDAREDAKRQGERAIADIETAKKVALSEIAGQTSSLAMGVAKQVVGRELKAEDHAELIRNALAQVPSKN